MQITVNQPLLVSTTNKKISTNKGQLMLATFYHVKSRAMVRTSYNSKLRKMVNNSTLSSLRRLTSLLINPCHKNLLNLVKEQINNKTLQAISKLQLKSNTCDHSHLTKWQHPHLSHSKYVKRMYSEIVPRLSRRLPASLLRSVRDKREVVNSSQKAILDRIHIIVDLQIMPNRELKVEIAMLWGHLLREKSLHPNHFQHHLVRSLRRRNTTTVSPSFPSQRRQASVLRIQTKSIRIHTWSYLTWVNIDELISSL